MKKLLAFLAAVLLASPALADPGIGDITLAGGGDPPGTNTPRIPEDGAVEYGFTNSVAPDSELFQVPLETELCFDPDTDTSGGAARITVFKAGNLSNPTTSAAIQLPAIPFNGLECVILKTGYHWIQVDTIPTGGELAKVFMKTLRTRVSE